MARDSLDPMTSAYTYEQSKEIVAGFHAGRVALCPLCGEAIHFRDASNLQRKAVSFECSGCGALDDSDRQP
jgi:predicted RNA-binding Zn-ribbon protein involved in translation (DUF1610 family)